MSDDILSIECPYTSCSAKVGEVCTNARNGEPMPNGHADRKKALRDREWRLANSGHRVEMSYNAWQIVRMVACVMRDAEVTSEFSDLLGDLLHELPPLNWGTPITYRGGRVSMVRPKTHRQHFSGSVLATLKKVMTEAAELKGGAFEGPCCVIAGQLSKIPDNAIDRLGSLA